MHIFVLQYYLLNLEIPFDIDIHGLRLKFASYIKIYVCNYEFRNQSFHGSVLSLMFDKIISMQLITYIVITA